MAETNGNGINGTAADRFTGLIGAWKQIANFGVIGVVAALLVWQSVVTRTDHREDMRGFREEAARAHGTMADLVNAIRTDQAATKDLAKAVRLLTAELQKPKHDPGGLELVPHPP